MRLIKGFRSNSLPRDRVVGYEGALRRPGNAAAPVVVCDGNVTLDAQHEGATARRHFGTSEQCRGAGGRWPIVDSPCCIAMMRAIKVSDSELYLTWVNPAHFSEDLHHDDVIIALRQAGNRHDTHTAHPLDLNRKAPTVTGILS